MCGIFFSASTKGLPRPRCLDFSKIPRANSFPCVLELGEKVIAQVLSEHLANETALTTQDQRKLDNLQRLRQLQLKLNKYKNARNDEMTEQVEEEMANLALEDTPAPVEDHLNVTDFIIPEILARGPDYALYQEISHGDHKLQLLSSVLSLRQPFTKQPVIGQDYILQFNGELYNEECLTTNDTHYISEKLESKLLSSGSRQDAFASVISLLDGEFAFVLTDLKENKVYFGKDYVGKRSLLFSADKGEIIISSVFPDRQNKKITECKSDRIHVVDLSSGNMETIFYSELWIDHQTAHQFNFSPLSGQYIIPEDVLGIRTQQLLERLSKATLVRQQTIHPIHPSREHINLGVLFSGGLDCTVLAGLIAKTYVEKGERAVIDLLTVGFENPRTGLGARESPDRKLSERSWFELSKAFHGTTVTFRLVQVDVLYAEWLSHRNHVLSLIYPCATEMDLSIAIAFYFASRAQNCETWEMVEGLLDLNWEVFSNERDSHVLSFTTYTSEAKVLFSGLGADELFGGYSRHENIFNNLEQSASESLVLERYSELSESLINDIKIIYERNLGRDDRAMACWGKELRYPYLDDAVIDFVVNKIEPQFKIRFEWATLKTKKGEKIVKVFVRKYILRCLARTLNLNMAADEIKRAIQFGARSAKLEVGKSKAKGTDIL